MQSSNGGTGDPASTTRSNGPVRPTLVIPADSTILVAIHDFEARSPDELTLHKGEQVELLERDEKFGDGWYLGRSIATHQKGLFPQVYTAPPVEVPVMHASPETTTQLVQATPSYPDTASAHSSIATSTTATPEPPRGSGLQSRSPAFDSGKQPGDIPTATATPPLSLERVNSARTTGIHRDSSFDRSSGFGGKTIEERQANHAPGLRSAVVEDTLSDIEEAISEISKNREHRGSSAIQDCVRVGMPPVTAGRLSAHLEANDDSSEYSVQEPPPDIFLSESENEGIGLAMECYDDFPYTRAEVTAWSPAEVAEYLKSRHVPSAICVKFEEQEVSGSILLELEMSHLKELELGSFGKRFQVWKEIEHLMKSVKHASAKSRNGNDAGRHSTVSFLEDAPHNRPPSGTVGSTGGPVLPRIPSQHNIPPSQRYRINVEEANAHQPGGDLLTPLTSTTISSSIASPTFSLFEQPRSPPVSPGLDRRFTNSYKRYSTHGHTSTALNVAMSAGAAVLTAGGTPDSNRSHQRESSFDKNWSNKSIGEPPRPATATGMREGDVTHKVNPSTSTAESSFTDDSGFSGSQAHSPEQFAATERSYFSSGESISRERKVLHKKNGREEFPDHCATEGTLKSGAAHLRHSRIASTGSDARKTSTTLSVALPSFLGGRDKHKRKSESFSGNLDGSLSDCDVSKTTSDRSSEGFMARPLSPAILVASAFAGRSISTTMKSSFEEPLSSPGATGSISTTDGSTPSVTVNTDGGVVPGKPPKVDHKKVRGIGSGSLRQKSKSSARKGLRNVSAVDATEGADYSGWMKKRGSSGIGLWKPRFFVLSGRRLAYFYSDQDTKERGLVDITSHKVLPASDDRLVELHAAFAAATSPITSPRPGSFSPAPDSPCSPKAARCDKEKEKEKEREKEKDKDKDKDKEQGWFTFKLVPPAPGTAKGVTFTPPRLHYLATDTRDEGKKWMAALMKATIDRDETSPVVTSYSAKTISLAQARALRIRPPHLAPAESEQGTSGLAISGIEMGTADGEEADIEDDRNGTPHIESERGPASYEASHNTDDDGSTIHDEEQVDSPSAAILPQTPKMDQHDNGPDAPGKQGIKQPVGEGILQLQAIGIVG